MIWNLGAGWLVMAIAVVAIVSFILSLALDAIMRRDGFGPIGNAVVITGSFFLSLYLVNLYGIRFRDVAEAVMMGIGGAFICFFVLALCKVVLNRL